MAGKRDSWVHEFLCGTRQHEGPARVLHPDKPVVVMGDSSAQSEGSVPMDMGAVLQAAKPVAAAPTPCPSIPQRPL